MKNGRKARAGTLFIRWLVVPLLVLSKGRADTVAGCAREIDVAARLLTKADEMEALAAGVRDLKILEGWRYDVFGKDALELVEGRLAFAVKDGRLLMTHVDEVHAGMVEAQAAE